MRSTRRPPVSYSVRSFSSTYDSDSDSDEDDEDDDDDDDDEYGAGSNLKKGPRQLRHKKALVLGSSGALGSYVARHLSVNLGMQVLGADLIELPAEITGEWQLDAFCPIAKNNEGVEELTVALTEAVYDFCHNNDNDISKSNNNYLNAIIVASGGFALDPATPAPVAPGAPLTQAQYLAGAARYGRTLEKMRRQNLDPVLAASYVAQHFMNPHHSNDNNNNNAAAGSLMVVIGATAALNPTPGMLGYGVSKAAAHHVVQTLGATTGQSQESRSVQKQGQRVRQHLGGLDNLTCVGILPTTLDTPANRQAMPEAVDTHKWTSIPALTAEISNFLTVPQLRPHSGSLVKIFNNKDGSGSAFLELVR